MRDWSKVRTPDSQILLALLESDGLTDDERKAFTDMQGRLEQRSTPRLSDRQRQWAETVWIRLGLADETGSENLASSGTVAVTDAERAEMDAWTRSLGPKPLKPPGRR